MAHNYSCFLLLDFILLREASFIKFLFFFTLEFYMFILTGLWLSDGSRRIPESLLVLLECVSPLLLFFVLSIAKLMLNALLGSNFSILMSILAFSF